MGYIFAVDINININISHDHFKSGLKNWFFV